MTFFTVSHFIGQLINTYITYLLYTNIKDVKILNPQNQGQQYFSLYCKDGGKRWRQTAQPTPWCSPSLSSVSLPPWSLSPVVAIVTHGSHKTVPVSSKLTLLTCTHTDTHTSAPTHSQPREPTHSHDHICCMQIMSLFNMCWFRKFKLLCYKLFLSLSLILSFHYTLSEITCQSLWVVLWCLLQRVCWWHCCLTGWDAWSNRGIFLEEPTKLFV